MNETQRITLDDSILDVLVKMSEGNPGALNVCKGLLENGAQIDPDDFMGGLGAISSLDSLGLYGAKIWMLHKDVCGQNLSKTVAMTRAWQLGILPQEQLIHAVENRGAGIDVLDLCQKVKDQLPNFKLDLGELSAKVTAPVPVGSGVHL